MLELPGETLAADGFTDRGGMEAGGVVRQQPERHLLVQVGREEERLKSLRPGLATVARTLQATPQETDVSE